MSKLDLVFKEKSKRILNVYCTAGYPALDSTMKVMASLQKNGADIIELGMPYSDPLADGEVIQVSSIKALANGMNIAVLFDQIKDMRKSISIPVILMGYMNPILQYGFENFCKKHNTAIILASHNMEEVTRLCDSVIMMSNGKITDQGSPESLLKKYGKKKLEDVFLKIARDKDNL